MVDFNFKCYHENSEGNVIGSGVDNLVRLELKLYDNNEDLIDTITISDENEINELIRQVNNLNNIFLDKTKLDNILSNTQQDTVINATLLNGLASDKYLKVADKDSMTFYPKGHASTNTDYGVGSTSEYGHNKVIDNLNRERYIDGEALSAHQGYELDERLSSLESSFSKNDVRILISRKSDGAGESETQLVVGHSSNDGLIARIDCGDTNFDKENRTIRFLVNGIIYERTTDSDGKTSALDINLPQGKYLVTVLMAGADGKNPVSEQKFLIVS